LNKPEKHHLTSAFTLIEVLISVLIISGSIVYSLQIYSQNHEQIQYVSQRAKISFQDSLFITQDVLSYNKDKKEAYDIVRRYFRVDNSQSREVLKSISREYHIPEAIKTGNNIEDVPTATIEEIIVKDRYSSSYFHFKLNGL